MDYRKFIVGTVVGAVALFAVGYLLFEVLLSDFYAANRGAATGVDRESGIIWAQVLGALAYAALICYAMGARGAGSVSAGVKAGAVVGFLLWFAADLTLYSLQNVSNLTIALVDPLVEAIHGGIAGGVIGWIVSRMKPAS
ncbi:MAG: hypothetical protein RL030_2252 [Pseudomonadota bacterium]|jgi:hypothetical protein